ncbi:hypothetical protein CERSUDRAFT_66644 [Gelatoporia subvermispora B]|uniref:Uncharacterized protein n=1 Tax=Ceriporiopsis subvermispora (strain B) TaxID=914234 RepID=M2QEQ0_CERS8|nr:hypothetical protein CERSUDRAFT_66644 [Gelatoporia subvermispora B]
MAITIARAPHAMHPNKRQRRTATSVLAGDFDTRPQRDVLTSLLNGVPAPASKEMESIEEARRGKVREKKEREKKEKRAKAPVKPHDKGLEPVASTSSAPGVPIAHKHASKRGRDSRHESLPRPSPSSFWLARPSIIIPTMQRQESVTPPPMASSPPTTPGPSISSTTSATSSKRPRTPYDDEDFESHNASITSGTPPPPKSRKKRPAVRKGWKGWVEGSPSPSEKLINLDVVTILPERKTRSGKAFDAIGVGKDSWV